MPIGFFSPLPLAMMIPFMATQSLAMGEAFGKSFQYGKRKISAMSNEEFNKYTISDMMNEQTADIRSLIPKLTQQMQDSQVMQGQIFAEMIKLVPTFVNSIQNALTGGNVNTDDPIQNLLPLANADTGGSSGVTKAELLQALAGYNPPGTKVSDANLDPNAQFYLDQNAGFKSNEPPPFIGPPDPTKTITIYISMTRTELLNNQPSQSSWIKAQSNYLEYQTAWNIAMAKLAPKTVKTPTPIKTFTGIKDYQKPEAIEWISKRDSLINSFTKAQKVTGTGNNAKLAAVQMKNAKQTLTQMSITDQRSPNNFIRSQAILLRQLLQRFPFV